MYSSHFYKEKHQAKNTLHIIKQETEIAQLLKYCALLESSVMKIINNLSK